MPDRRIALSLVLHNHQPVGNFGFVFEEAYDRAYRPMLEALERHEGVRIGLHYTGPLLEWLKSEHPDFLTRLRALVEREQVEVLGGGYYEPVLASLRENDRVGQLTRMADEVEALVGRRPTGAWLAERVWEPDVPTSLVKAGYRYTIVDDAHFRAAAIPPELHWGPYSTDDQGYRVLVFGSEQGLRYHIPFRPVDEVITYLREHATEDGRAVGMMGDDGEKFGTWPGTWELCFGRERWVEAFFGALEENAAWLSTVRPDEALQKHPPIGRVYLPTGSYIEMGEWSLPLEARREYSRLLAEAVAEGKPEASWMRGGFWRMFQVKYREINDLHKQMLRTSRKVAAVAAAGRGEAAAGPGKARGVIGEAQSVIGEAQSVIGEAQLAGMRDHLYQGQSNDCYWHGLFGGIYLAHLRLATLAHLIAAEDASDRALGQAGVKVRSADFDVDGYDELLVSAPGQVLLLKPDEGGGIGSWDVRAVRHALTSVMRRRPEVYHDKLRAVDRGEIEQLEAGAGAVSIHDLVQVNEPGISARLWYDEYERRSALVHLLPLETTPEAFERADYRELGDFVGGEFAVELAEGNEVMLVRDGSVGLGGAVDSPRTSRGERGSLRVRKRHIIGDDRRAPWMELTVEVTNTGERAVEALLGVELAINMLGGGGNPAAWYEVDGERGRFDAGRVDDSIDSVRMGNDYIGVELESRASPDAAAWWSSIETISVSESGFEGIHQGGCLLWVWPLALVPGASMTVELANLVRSAADRAEEEGL